MGFYFDICNKSIKYKYLDSLSEDEYDRCIHIEKKIKNPNYFKIDEIFKDYITEYNKKLDLNLVKCDFEVEFINYTDLIKTEYSFNTSIVNLKNCLIYHIYHVISGGRKF